MEVPSLAENEQMVRDSMAASLTGSRWPTQGRLILTTERLIYRPAAFRPIPVAPPIGQRLDIVLSEISRVELRTGIRRMWGGYPGLPLFEVRLNDDTMYVFQVPEAQYWQQSIANLIRSHPK